MPRKRSPWDESVYMPPGHGRHIREPEIIFFGANPIWSADRDLTMGRQDPTGLWSPGQQRRGVTCHLCGGVPGENVYCAGCSAVSERLEAKLEAEYLEDIAREADRIRREQERQEAEKGTFAERKHGKKPGRESAA